MQLTLKEPDIFLKKIKARMHLNQKICFSDEQLDKVATKIISGLEKVESRLSNSDIRFLHVDINEVSDISVTSVPSLVYFKNGEPVVYDGKCLMTPYSCQNSTNTFSLFYSTANLLNVDSIQHWAEDEYKTNQDVIEDYTTDQIKELVQEFDYVLVFVCELGLRIYFVKIYILKGLPFLKTSRTASSAPSRSESWRRWTTTWRQWGPGKTHACPHFPKKSYFSSRFQVCEDGRCLLRPQIRRHPVPHHHVLREAGSKYLRR